MAEPTATPRLVSVAVRNIAFEPPAPPVVCADVCRKRTVHTVQATALLHLKAFIQAALSASDPDDVTEQRLRIVERGHTVELYM